MSGKGNYHLEKQGEKMLAEESGTSSFDLPEEVLEVLPSDPFEQLDVARKITSIALSTRVSALESEASDLRAKLAEKDLAVDDLHSQIKALDAALSEIADKLAVAEQEKERLLKENTSLSNAVKKLNRDVSKLESFRKTLMQSLHEDEESSGASPQIVAKQMAAQSTLSSASTIGEDDAASRYSSTRSQYSEIGNSFAEDRETDASRAGVLHNFLLTSQTNTPRLTPPGSPPTLSASVSPRRHSISLSTSRGMFDDRSSVFSSVPASQYSSMSSSESGSQTGRTRVDGKEFFRQVRSRLSYEQFGAFLANVKELNSHKQTREETLRKADKIFGPDNKDLYAVFEGLITRNVH